MPRRLAVRAIRHAISPRLAIRTDANMGDGLAPPRLACPSKGLAVSAGRRSGPRQPPLGRYLVSGVAVAAAAPTSAVLIGSRARHCRVSPIDARTDLAASSPVPQPRAVRS